LAPQVDLETVIAANPQVILTAKTPLLTEQWKQPWLRWQSLSAVIHESLYTVPADFISRQTPRILQGVEIVCEHFQKNRSKLFTLRH